MYPRYKYWFQFNNDVASCVALQTMIANGWTVQDYKVEGGYKWFILWYEH